jgi:lipid-A-disaccharide synthase-like uncharacterized protein
MATLRIILSTLVTGALLWLLVGTVVRGLRTGKIRYLDSTSTCDRKSHPLLFWFLVALFAVFSLVIASVWLKGVLG